LDIILEAFGRLGEVAKGLKLNSLKIFDVLYKRPVKNLHILILIKLNDLPVTSKVDLMGEFDNWLTDRSLTLAQAREHMDSMDNLGVPIGQYAVFRTSGSSGEPAVIVIPSSVLEFIFGLSLARLSKKQLQIEKKIRKAGSNVIITGGNGHFAGVGLDTFCWRWT
jgi:hypothetical protein